MRNTKKWVLSALENREWGSILSVIRMDTRIEIVPEGINGALFQTCRQIERGGEQMELHVNGVKLYYRVSGHGPAVILVQGMGKTTPFFDETLLRC